LWYSCWHFYSFLICSFLTKYIYIYVYTHHLSCWQWSDDDNKSHVTFAYRVPQLSCSCPATSLCKTSVNDIQLVAICSMTFADRMQPNTYDKEKESEDSPITSVFVFIPNKYLTFFYSVLFKWCRNTFEIACRDKR
jgi:hypothetical protein